MAAIFAGAVHPDAGQFRDAAGLNSELRQRIDDASVRWRGRRRRRRASTRAGRRSDSRHLAGAVIGDVAAAIGRIKCDAGARRTLGLGEQIFRVAVAADGDDVRVFDEAEAGRDRALFAVGGQLSLESSASA